MQKEVIGYFNPTLVPRSALGQMPRRDPENLRPPSQCQNSYLVGACLQRLLFRKQVFHVQIKDKIFKFLRSKI